ncbi:MAG: recombinase family protein [Burkholderiales bacterium]|nr:recombinase family protein [Burkholderiales bacterium]
MASNNAVLYLRSSKDRSDVSIDAQRRELQTLAKTKELQIVGEFSDVVVSGKNENRPGFQDLLSQLKNSRRTWQFILMYDTSRLARNQYIAHVFRHECKKQGVEAFFVMTPDLDGIAGIIMPAILHAVDEMHSFVSKEKGLAGMAENVRRGFRAGGRAPYGYQLDIIDTGAIREGEAVTKSRLMLDKSKSALVAKYLKGRAAQIPRTELARRIGLDVTGSTLVCLEWNALTYAGHTVWNVHNERVGGKYAGGVKRRPREEWQMQRDTHPALITEAEAEAILARLAINPHIGQRAASYSYLLSGLLVDPLGNKWQGDRDGEGNGTFYRAPGKGRRVIAEKLDSRVITQVVRDLRSKEFAKGLSDEAHRCAGKNSTETALEKSRSRLAAIDKKMNRYAEMAVEAASPRVFYDKIAELEKQRAEIESALAVLEQASAERNAWAAMTEPEAVKMLAGLADTIEGPDGERPDPERMKDMLVGFIDKIKLNPSDLSAAIHYRIQVPTGVWMASPGGFEPPYSP